MNKEHVLKSLITKLSRMVGMMELDPGTQWGQKFRNDLGEAESLAVNGFTTEDLANLSRSIMFVFGGVGSFNDYEPSIYDPATGKSRAIPGTEDFGGLRSDVFDLALALRTLDQ